MEVVLEPLREPPFPSFLLENTWLQIAWEDPAPPLQNWFSLRTPRIIANRRCSIEKLNYFCMNFGSRLPEIDVSKIRIPESNSLGESREGRTSRKHSMVLDLEDSASRCGSGGPCYTCKGVELRRSIEDKVKSEFGSVREEVLQAAPYGPKDRQHVRKPRVALTAPIFTMVVYEVHANNRTWGEHDHLARKCDYILRRDTNGDGRTMAGPLILLVRDIKGDTNIPKLSLHQRLRKTQALLSGNLPPYT
ncbi:hypothetical protein VNO77_34170 [Canavalia gladiata]|uniref:Uncharacterized protein n=1 Tax=Canavalia gladiata TaxID=3824 RepID=A0AAN9KFP9_CANGL